MAKVIGEPDGDKPEDYITALVQLQKECGVLGLEMNGYGFTLDESMTLADNAGKQWVRCSLRTAVRCPARDVRVFLINHTVKRGQTL